MAKPVWSATQPSNTSLGSFVERKTLGVNNVPNIDLLITGDNVTVSIISGKLPGGLRLEGLSIVGTPFAIIGSVTSRFVIRAKNSEGISDRTFTITITSLTESIKWTTPEGTLPVGPNNHYYILDNSWVDFQLDALDEDILLNKYLNYHIPVNGGDLPKGITLSETGRLSGFTAPLLDVKTGYTGSQGYSNGNFDITNYDNYGYDYGVRPTNGYDSFYFDNTTYDFFNASRAPKKLNRHYNFIVRASDGGRYVDRQFQIYVVGDDYMRSDNDILRVGTNTYTADITFMRKPIWITKNYIGRLRANNYITIILDVFDPSTLEGSIGYLLAPNNNEVVTTGSWVNGNHVELTNANNWLSSGATGSIENIRINPENGEWLADIRLSIGYTIGLGIGSIITTASGTGKIGLNTTVYSLDLTYLELFTITSSTEPLPGTITSITSESISVISTAHLVEGMSLYVTDGIGSFVAGTKIKNISGKTFTITRNVATRLTNASVFAVTTSASFNIAPVDLNTIIGNLEIGQHIDCAVNPIFILDVLQTDSTTGYLTCGSTANLTEGMSIIFNGNMFGNIIPDTIYYVKTIIDSKNFTISKTFEGPVASLTTETSKVSEKMSVSYPSSKIPPEAVVTGWNYFGEYSSIATYNFGEIIKYDNQLYKVIAQSPITNISPLNDTYFSTTRTFPLTISWDSPTDVVNTRSALLRIGTPSTLPPKMQIDPLTGEIYGSVPPQSAITKNYKFTVIALRYSIDPAIPNVPSYRTFNVDIIGEIDSVIHFTTDGDLGTIDANFISNLSVNAVTTIPDAVLTYKLKSGRLPPGLILVNDGTLQGKVNQFSDGIYYKSMWKPNSAYIVNDVVRSNEKVVKYYKCVSSHTSSNLFDVAKWAIYSTDTYKDGIITFDKRSNYYDGATTTFDKSYTFTIETQDQFNESATTKTFKLLISTPNNKLYSNIYLKPFLKQSMRSTLLSFFNDPTIFEMKSIYRASDPNFGIQTELKMLLYSGIESKLLSKYVSAFNRSSRKKFRIGNLKKAIAKTPGTNDIIYELIYLEIIDNLENENGSVAAYINTAVLNHVINVNQGKRDIIDSVLSDDVLCNISSMSIDRLSRILIQDTSLTVDFGGQLVSDKNKSSIFGNSVTNIRNLISSIGDTERKYLPLWMRTPQTFSGIEQGFIKAVPICYCMPGTANNIILNIKNSGFDFKMIDYTVDRAIIDSTISEAGDKYIAFAAREVING